MIRRRVVPVLVCALVLVACGSGDGDDADDTDLTTTQFTLLPTTTEAATTTTTVAPTTTTPSTTTSTTTTVAPEDTTTTVADPAVEALVLSSEGIGSAEFGADPDGVITYLSSFLGDPTNDTGWIDPLEIGACAGTEIRFVEWGVLTLLFGDVSQVVQGRRHFFSFNYGSAGEVGGLPAGLVTSRGVTIGSRLVDVTAAYPGATLNPEDDFTSANFYVNDNLRGYLTGLADDSTVTVVLGGVGCGE